MATSFIPFVSFSRFSTVSSSKADNVVRNTRLRHCAKDIANLLDFPVTDPKRICAYDYEKYQNVVIQITQIYSHFLTCFLLRKCFENKNVTNIIALHNPLNVITFL